MKKSKKISDKRTYYVTVCPGVKRIPFIIDKDSVRTSMFDVGFHDSKRAAQEEADSLNRLVREKEDQGCCRSQRHRVAKLTIDLKEL